MKSTLKIITMPHQGHLQRTLMLWKTTIIIVFVIISSMLSAQPWLSKLPQDKPIETLTLFDYQKAFTDYWAPYNVVDGYYDLNGVKTKAIGWKQFHRWVWDIENQVDVETGKLPVKTAQEVVDEYLRIKPALSRSIQANWTSMGTNSSTGGYAGIGRLNCIAFHPTDLNTYWIGAPSGGLWVTHDNGSSWTCLTNNTEVIGVSDIVIPTDYDTSHTIFIATGDRDHWDNRSVGVLKSTDGGITWKTTGLSYTLASYTMVTRLLLDPSNNNTIIAATTRGVYKTTDGGTTWNTQLTPKNFVDMEFKPGDYNTLYGSNTSGGIYVSSNGGANWSQVVMISNGGRVELAVSPNQSTWVYAVVGSNINGLYGVYKSTNSGAGYTKIFDGKQPGNNLLGWSSTGSDSTGQAWYDLAIDVSPTNANVVLVGGVNTWRSNDAGLSWEIINHWWGDGVQAVHADKHMLKFRSNGDLFECNDGGIYFSEDDGTNFTDITNGMVISQMYKLGVSQTSAEEVITGLQDNGTKAYSKGVWDDVLGGDGMECLIDYTDENIQYGSIYYGSLHRTDDHWSSSQSIKPDSAGKGAWITPFVIDPVNHNTLYAGFKEVWKTTDQGNSWTRISDLKLSDNLLYMAVATTNNKVIVVAHGNNIWKTVNGGTTWTEITGNLPISTSKISNVAIKHSNPNTIWVTMGGYVTPGVYESTNGDTIWTDISAGLPQIPAYSVVQNIQDTSDVQLYVGTELGVYMKYGTDNWVDYNSGLPNVKIGELDIYYNKNIADSRLRAATYGRGLWETSLYFKYLPMSFKSLTTTQKNITSAAPSDINAEIICLKISTENPVNPLVLSAINMSMDGTTDINDVSNISIYYTGLDSVFSPVNLFAMSNPANGIIAFNGNQALENGVNYIWIAYDIKSSAKYGNYLDAQVFDVTLDSVRIPDIIDPPGARIISRKYCAGGTNDTMMEYISGVSLGNISTTSGWGENGYQDFSGIVKDLIRGVKDSIVVTITSPAAADELLIWADWNQDGVFVDATEKIYSSGIVGYSLYATSFIPPSTADTGFTRLRIRLNNTSAATASSDPCAVSGFGEVEDYSIRMIHNVGIRKITDFNDLAIYPNPATDQLTIECKSISESIDVEIFNTMGQSIYKSRFSNKAVINLTDISSGVYVIKLKSGESLLMKKFVKE